MELFLLIFLKIRTVNATTIPNAFANPCLSGAEIALIILKTEIHVIYT